jgi:hypothetical protein
VKDTVRKTHAWIFDSFGARRSGMLEVRQDEDEGLRPADKTWRHLTTFPLEPHAGEPLRVVLWADTADKYIVRLDIGTTHRFMILEGLPALLANVGPLNALLQMSRGGKS